ncbi:WLM domain-containing protein [Lentinula detonsa]|uniref:WLM domain-containing protein n=1 Tax=Lentinula detonsa TaxID=2804962 RepID=A0AA38Q5N9_9AGAR|nr:WLM domain-containing protein [Lentinula detonsa]
MVHSRFNEKETNPNPHINFITPLPAENSHDAREYLRALAAQVRPVMKAHAFTVNSLEEYEHNAVFAGRNWNNGETIELVLRRPSGSFLPSSWLMSTLCHELAHNKHMNHGPAFQALWRRLRNEVRQLQNKGYYGDGYWSAGTRLADSAVISGEGLDMSDLPEYICGGAQSRTRPSNLRQRRGPRRPREMVASNKTGRQTAKQRKAGTRVTSKYAFQGEGISLGAIDTGKGFGKKASSKRAREERVLAVERRMQSLASSSTVTVPLVFPAASTSYAEHSEDAQIIIETNADRKQTLLDAELDSDEDLEKLGSGAVWKDFENDFTFTGHGRPNVIVISSDDESDSAIILEGKGKRKADVFEQMIGGFTTSHLPWSEYLNPLLEPSHKIRKKSDLNIGLGKIVETEVTFRKKEALGMTGKGRTIGDGAKCTGEHTPWYCLVCTLENEPYHLVCAACRTEKRHV